MLGAGVFGTVVGDVCSHHFGQGPSALALTFVLVSLLVATKSRSAADFAVYWCAVALARTAGTCAGDWFAENRILHIGLPVSTLMTGLTFVAILVAWRSPHLKNRVATGA
jgi:uncharacterized membrane-anchored protein